VATNCSACPRPDNWQPTGSLRCALNGSGTNTGYQERQEVNAETCSNSYGTTRWVSNGLNPGACPVTIYAKISYTNFVYGDNTTATVWINFYSDAACTIATPVSNLTVNYQRVRTICSTGSTLTTSYTASGISGTSYSLGTQTLATNDGIHCYNYVYSITAGTGYVAK